ncbi:MAG: PLP-dependent aminotransferase family protein [Elusimicrobiaceae bacterium]|nr:PLP-dependent aminotransferase family protein [Elusimicrobiaceae bacterium]
MVNLNDILASVTKRAQASVLRELLKRTSEPGIISFAGGLPDPKSFPVEQIKKVLDKILTEQPHIALQYCPTEGLAVLKTEIIKLLKEENINLEADNILITTSSQQGLELVGRAFIDLGDTIIVSNPSYMGALQVFKSYGAKMEGIDSDDNGIIPESLEAKLQELQEKNIKCKFVYLVPDFQNPAGTTIPQERRVKILEIAKKYNVLLVEDSPYRQVRFEGEAPEMFYKLDGGKGENVLSLFTFSKTFVPGIRLGFAIGKPELIANMCVLKQSIDLCAPSLSQLITSEFMASGYLNPHIEKVTAIYKKKKDAMIKALETYMPEGVRWTKPEGGLFLWVELPKNISADDMFDDAIAKKVAYVIGSAFHHDGSGKNTMRLNFSYATIEEIDEGIKRLAECVKDYASKVS